MRLVLIALLLFVQQGPGRWNIEGGQVQLDQMGCSGTPSVTTFLRGDCSWTTVSGGSSVWGDLTGTLSDQTDLNTALNGKAASAHVHPQSEVTNLVTDLAGKETANANIQAHIVSAHAPSNAQANADITKAEIEAKLTGVISTHSHSGGSAPVYVVLSSGTLAMAFATNDTVKITPSATQTFTTTVPAAGYTKTLIILTSGTTSRTITFGTGFKPTATLATGTVSGRVFVIHWISDGVNLYEAGRTIAMVA